MLGSHPEEQEHAHQELRAIFQDSDRDPTATDLTEMKYLERVIKETLRLYPSVPFISRRLDEDVQLSKKLIFMFLKRCQILTSFIFFFSENYSVPAKSVVLISIYNVHRDPDNFSDPTKFVPDRFLPEAMRERNPYSYIPFSAGPRNCIGKKLII